MLSKIIFARAVNDGLQQFKFPETKGIYAAVPQHLRTEHIELLTKSYLGSIQLYKLHKTGWYATK